MSRPYDILEALADVKDITPSSVSNFITTNSGFTVSDVDVKKYGKLLAVNFIVTRNVAWAANDTGEIGTLKQNFRPKINSGGASATFRELVLTDGRVYARPGSAVSANSREAYSIMYLVP